MSRNFKLLLISLGVIFIGTYAKELIKESKAGDAAARFKAACEANEKSEGTIPVDKLQAVCTCTAEKSLKRLGYERFTKVTNQGVDAPENDVLVLKSAFAGCAKEHVGQN